MTNKITERTLYMSILNDEVDMETLKAFAEKKIAQLDEYRKNFNLSFKIGVDGGINNITGPLCVDSGVDWLVAGSYYFNAENKTEALNSLHKAKVIE